MKLVTRLLFTLTLSALCGLTSAGQPVLGDSWDYQYSSHDFNNGRLADEVVHVVVVAYNLSGKPIFKGWSSFGMHSDTCLFDVFTGAEIPGEVSCADPLPVGKTWYAGPLESFRGPKQWFTIMGTEKVEVAGEQYIATIITTVAPLPGYSGYRRSKYLYSPEVKGMISVVHEVLEANGLVAVVENFSLLAFHPVSGN
jgi:hypothetical protein